jgi:RNA polymerase subunit RPABC4/transcription elongation factor Spt4
LEAFTHIELESKPDHIREDVEYYYKLRIDQKIPKFDRKEYSTAWLKYLLDHNKVITASRICGRCRTTLLDGEQVCGICGSKNLVRFMEYYDVMVTNGEQIITISLEPDKTNNAWYIGRRLCKLFREEYLPLMISEDILITTYGCREEFPDVWSSEAVNKLYWIFMDRSDNRLYILDYFETYVGNKAITRYIESEKYVLTNQLLKLDYIEVTEDNIDLVLNRAKRNQTIIEDAYVRR